MIFLTGIESTHIYGTGTDILELNRHLEVYEKDLTLIKKSGIKTLRYPVPWHRIEEEEGKYDWSWMDSVLSFVKFLKLDPILDPLHHTSFPFWLKGGFLNPNFVKKYCDFLVGCARRYPWIKKYTIVNEPFVTALLCGKLGVWYPYGRSYKIFLQMLMNLARATCLGAQQLIESLGNLVFVHVDAAEAHHALSPEPLPAVDFRNNLRFLFLDMILGRVNDRHKLFSFLRRAISLEDMFWLERNQVKIDVLGLDYYAHSECEWIRSGGKLTRVWPPRSPAGFSRVAEEYYNRYKIPLMLSETNIRGEVTDRIAWLRFMLQECEKLEKKLRDRRGIFKGFTWYPFVDSTDWDSLVREANGNVDPQGIILLDNVTRWHEPGRCERFTSELSLIYSRLARGRIKSSSELPNYLFQPGVARMLQGFKPLME